MKFKFDTPINYNFFQEVYIPLWLKYGFSWSLFPELTIGINKKLDDKARNSDKEHYDPYNKYIFVRIMPMPFLTVEQYKAVYPSSLFHEIMHHIHFEYFGKDNSETWHEAFKLMNKKLTKDMFEWKDTGRYIYKPAYEDIANYFEAIIEGRNHNNAFINWVKKIINLNSIKLSFDEYIMGKDIEGKDRAYLPIRKVGEKLGFKVTWLSNVRKVIVQNENKTIELTDKDFIITKDENNLDRAFIPIRKVSEALDCEVNWIPDTRDIFIIKR